MSIDKKAANYIKDLYDEPTDLLETYEAYKDGYNAGKADASWTDKMIYGVFGAIIFVLTILAVEHFKGISIFK